VGITVLARGGINFEDLKSKTLREEQLETVELSQYFLGTERSITFAEYFAIHHQSRKS
jgi:hypothetical protein